MALFISTIVITGAAIVASIIHALVPRISINYVSMIIGGRDCFNCAVKSINRAFPF